MSDIPDYNNTRKRGDMNGEPEGDWVEYLSWCSVCGDPLCDRLCESEPEEGDLITEDWRTFWEVGDHHAPVLCFSAEMPWAEVCALIRLYFSEQRFWPDVWFISDHGNAHLLDIYHEEG